MWNVKGVLEYSVAHVLGNFGIAVLRDPHFSQGTCISLLTGFCDRTEQWPAATTRMKSAWKAPHVLTRQPPLTSPSEGCFLSTFAWCLRLRRHDVVFLLDVRSCWPDCVHQVYSLHNTNKLNAQFSKLIFNFNFWCLLHVSNFLGSSSRRQLCMRFYMHRCEQSGG